jgi:sugar lactone lactonase YvrE
MRRAAKHSHASHGAAFLLVLAVAACSEPPPSHVPTPGAHCGSISATGGGSIAITSADDAQLGGASIDVAPNALAEDTVICVSTGAASVTPGGGEAAGPVVRFEPDGTRFLVPVTITLRYALPSGYTTSDLNVAAVESTGEQTTYSGAQLNIGASTVSFSISGFTDFGPYVTHVPDGGSDAGPLPQPDAGRGPDAGQAPDANDVFVQDAGSPSEPDASTSVEPDAGTLSEPDSGPTPALDAGPSSAPDADWVFVPDAGSVSEPDAGNNAEPDAGSSTEPDAGAVPVPDAGAASMPDAGSTPVPDAGTSPEPDAGSNTEPDAGEIAVPDAGTNSILDAGSPSEPDAGLSSEPDAGTNTEPDAGVSPPADAGVPCSPIQVTTLSTGQQFADGTGGSNGTATVDGQTGVAVDGTGNIYVSEWATHSIRKIDTSLNVTTLAGNGRPGYADGPGGPNGIAQFYYPMGVAVDRNGNVYVADLGNNRIRKIDPSGNVTTLAGNGSYGYTRYIDGTGGPDGTANFDFPTGVAVDSSGEVYVADSYDNVIRRIDTEGMVSTVAGTGVPGFKDGSGGPGGIAELNYPTDVVVDSQHNLYVTDFLNDAIRKIDPGGNVSTIAGGPPDPYWGSVILPQGIALDSRGNVLFNNGSYILKVGSQGNVTTVGPPNYSTAGLPEYFSISSIAVDPQGNPIFAGGGVFRLLENQPIIINGYEYASETAEPLTPSNYPTLSVYDGIAADGAGYVFAADSTNNRIIVIDSRGNASVLAGGTAGYRDGSGGPGGTAELSQPNGVTLDGAGGLYVADSGNNCIRRIDSYGNVSTVSGGAAGYADGTSGPGGTAKFKAPHDVARDGLGNLFVADTGNNRIREIDTSGNVTTLAGNGTAGYQDGTGGPQGTAEFRSPANLTVDTEGNVYVSDAWNQRIRKIDPQGNVTTLAGNGIGGFNDGSGGPNGTAEFASPAGITVDALFNVFVADSGNNRIRRIDPAGNVRTLAGGGQGWDFTQAVDGTGGPGGTSLMPAPMGVALAPDGTLFVSDDDAHIRVITGSIDCEPLPSVTGPSGPPEPGFWSATGFVGADCPLGGGLELCRLAWTLAKVRSDSGGLNAECLTSLYNIPESLTPPSICSPTGSIPDPVCTADAGTPCWNGPYVEWVTNDPWNNPYSATMDPNTYAVTVFSNGPDGIFGTSDDVSFSR